jgi:hypothetical protein
MKGSLAMNATEVGRATLVGWREKAADAIAGPISGRTRLSDDQVRAAVGVLFFVLSVSYVAGTVRRAVTAAGS